MLTKIIVCMATIIILGLGSIMVIIVLASAELNDENEEEYDDEGI